MKFEKGKSGNPRGRPRGQAGLAKSIRAQTDDLQELAEIALGIARDESAQNRDRISALNLLLDRALGRPEQSVHLEAALSARAALPPSWDALSLAEKLEFLDGGTKGLLPE